jgi:glutamate-1-semialdehyde 2,1-aminomutase
MTMRQRTQSETELLTTARKVLPAGHFNFAPEIVIRDGKGAHVWDESGNQYVDFLLGSGPMFLGHAHPDVTAAVAGQLARGTTFFANNGAAIRLAAEIVSAVPCAEQVRFLSSGTEATQYAMRIVRAFRGRSKILKFEGGFHGMGDWALMSVAPKRPGNFPLASPDSAGIPEVLRGEMLIAPFNDIDATTALIEEYRDDLAGVIMEPFQRLIEPKPGFLEAVRAVTAKHGIPLVFDEIVTGFRFAYGGAQEHYGVVPDLCALGKILGGGFPLAAVAGREEIMRHFDRGKVAEEHFAQQTGTLSGNPVAAEAGLATLEVLKRPGVYDQVYATGRALMEGLQRAFEDARITAQVTGHPTCFEAFFTDTPVTDYRSMQKADPVRQKLFHALLLERGVLKAESKFYVSTAHATADVDHAIAAFRAAARALARSR